MPREADTKEAHPKAVPTLKMTHKLSVDRTTVNIQTTFKLLKAKQSHSQRFSNPMIKVASLTQEVWKIPMPDIKPTSASRTCQTDLTFHLAELQANSQNEKSHLRSKTIGKTWDEISQKVRVK